MFGIQKYISKIQIQKKIPEIILYVHFFYLRLFSWTFSSFSLAGAGWN